MRIEFLTAPVLAETALVLAEDTFGHLDLQRSSVRQELSGTAWDRSVGVFDDQGCCLAHILVSGTTLPDYIDRELSGSVPFDYGGFRGMTCLRGDSLIVCPEARHLVPAMFNRLLKKGKPVDYLWGNAHSDLDNMGFWRKHANILGAEEGGTKDWFFVVPLGRVAKNVVEGTLPCGRMPSA